VGGSIAAKLPRMSDVVADIPVAVSNPAASSEEFAGDLCCMLSRASHALTKELTAALDEVGISQRAHSVLSAAATGEFSQIELARIVGLDKTTMVVTIDELEAQGLAERRQSKVDRRARVIVVTEAGSKLVRDADALAFSVRDDVLAALDPSERRAFMDSLAKLVGDRLAEPVNCSQTVRRRGSV
jgi:MarR family transcriptional regulator, transcriptional regulator for hemolysin